MDVRYDEGWLLRAVLKEWKTCRYTGRLGFLPFPPGAQLYSEGQLCTPFGARRMSDPLAEKHTHADGIVGHFSIPDTKSGVVLDQGFSYFTVLEAKLSSPLAKGTKNAPAYDQAARTVACMINMILQVPHPGPFVAHFVVVYPANNQSIRPDQYTKEAIAAAIARRIGAYDNVTDWREATSPFARQWVPVLDRLCIWFVTWEEVIAEIANDELRRFYELCLRFN